VQARCQTRLPAQQIHETPVNIEDDRSTGGRNVQVELASSATFLCVYWSEMTIL
jgi:hypothetical protein